MGRHQLHSKDFCQAKCGRSGATTKGDSTNGKIWGDEIHQFGFGNGVRLVRQKVTS